MPWSWSETNDLSASVRTFFEKRNPCHFPLSPCIRDHTYYVAVILSADENDQNEYPLCCKAITTSDSTWEKGPLFYHNRYIIYIPPWLVGRSQTDGCHCSRGARAWEGMRPLPPAPPGNNKRLVGGGTVHCSSRRPRMMPVGLARQRSQSHPSNGIALRDSAGRLLVPRRGSSPTPSVGKSYGRPSLGTPPPPHPPQGGGHRQPGRY
jgi:hypothetical protein